MTSWVAVAPPEDAPLVRRVDAETPLQKALRTRLTPEWSPGGWTGRLECREKGCRYTSSDMAEMERHLSGHARPETAASWLGLEGNAVVDGEEL